MCWLRQYTTAAQQNPTTARTSRTVGAWSDSALLTSWMPALHGTQYTAWQPRHSTLAAVEPQASHGCPSRRCSRVSGGSDISFILRRICSGTLLRAGAPPLASPSPVAAPPAAPPPPPPPLPTAPPVTDSGPAGLAPGAALAVLAAAAAAAAASAFFFLKSSAFTTLHSATCFSNSSLLTMLSHTGQKEVDASRFAMHCFMWMAMLDLPNFLWHSSHSTNAGGGILLVGGGVGWGRLGG